MLDEDYFSFTIFLGIKLLECENCNLGMHFVDFHHEMFNEPDGKNFLGAYWIFIHDFYLHIVELNLMLNNKTHGSDYNAEHL